MFVQGAHLNMTEARISLLEDAATVSISCMNRHLVVAMALHCQRRRRPEDGGHGVRGVVPNQLTRNLVCPGANLVCVGGTQYNICSLHPKLVSHKKSQFVFPAVSYCTGKCVVGSVHACIG
ncbi:hypothetical protein JG688_00016881 [Phytophthora aleatoria]|uniref:Uncharacterized protein n=1 Tax=Phytophthora aleatoria TaxID=2496075 RepID=A0A8J5LYU8_9STRA|nr:hypothetical protein JG688_00016881 [Phytophthora aleatoria]